MIITKLNGGLGNQMFQYAVGRRLAEHLNVELKLDLNGMRTLEEYREEIGYKSNVHFYYRLNFLNVKENFATQSELDEVPYDSKSLLGGIIIKFQKFLHLKKFNYITEKKFNFDPAILSLKDNIYLDGFWQSEKYFSDIIDIIRKEFSFKEPPKDENKVLSEQISNSNSVSILVRRGALVHDPKTKSIHGFCPLEYYETCVNKIAQVIKDPTFFVFSDEPEWAQSNLKLKYPTIFIKRNGRKYYHEDLRLMSICQHAITSNSSWGWWGAWLIENPNKIVYAPKKWLNQNYDTSDLIPQDWVLV